MSKSYLSSPPSPSSLPPSPSQEIPPSYATVSLPWKHLYLQHNLQELVGKLNDNPDFKVCWSWLRCPVKYPHCVDRGLL